ncbi:MCP four helix bundle domain-containing protein, partial [Telmatospirillum siberiense]
MRVTIKTKLAASFGVVILLSVITAAVAVSGLSELNDTVDRLISLAAERVKSAGLVNSALLEIVRAEKNMMLSKTDDEIERYSNQITSNRDQLKTIREHYYSIASDEGKQKLDVLAQNLDKYYALQDKTRQFSKSNSEVRAALLAQTDARQALNATVETLRPLSERLDMTATTQPTDKAKQAILTERLINRLYQIQRDEKNIITTSDPQMEARYVQAMAENADEARRLRDTLRQASGTEDRLVIDRSIAEMDKWLKIHDEVVALARQHSSTQAFALSTGETRQIVAQIQGQVKDLIQVAERYMASEKANAESRYQTIRLTLFSVLFASLVISVAAAALIAISLGRGMGRAVSLANAVAIGDLDQQVQVTSNDEIKDLVDAMNRMTANLRATAELASTVAKGDLSVQTKRLSDKDVLGIAIENMVANLRATAHVAETIAKGDLAVETKRLSDKDVLGIALENMVANLQGTARVAETIAKGDLAVETKRLSDKDVLGIALENMIANLRGTARVAETIAKGDLTIQAKPLSDKDTLGIALETMLAKLQTVVADAAMAADNVASGSQQLSAGSEQLSQGASEQAASTEEASAS